MKVVHNSKTKRVKKFAWLPSVMTDGKIVWFGIYFELYYKIDVDKYALAKKIKK